MSWVVWDTWRYQTVHYYTLGIYERTICVIRTCIQIVGALVCSVGLTQLDVQVSTDCVA